MGAGQTGWFLQPLLYVHVCYKSLRTARQPRILGNPRRVWLFLNVPREKTVQIIGCLFVRDSRIVTNASN